MVILKWTGSLGSLGDAKQHRGKVFLSDGGIAQRESKSM